MDKCKNCGASKGIHRFDTMACPAGGTEAPMGKKQEWSDTKYYPDRSMFIEDIKFDIQKFQEELKKRMTPKVSRGDILRVLEMMDSIVVELKEL